MIVERKKLLQALSAKLAIICWEIPENSAFAVHLLEQCVVDLAGYTIMSDEQVIEEFKKEKLSYD